MRRFRRLARTAVLGALVLSWLGLVTVGGPEEAAEASTDVTIYYDSLASPWKNWSWNSTEDFAYSTAYSGTKSIKWTVTSASGGLYLHSDTGVATTSTTTVQFALRASTTGQKYTLSLYDGNNQNLGKVALSNVGGDPPAGSWKLYTIGVGTLNGASKTIKGVQLQDAKGSAQPYILVDQIKLIGVGTTSTSTSNCLSVPAYTEIRSGNYTANHTKPSLVSWQWGTTGAGLQSYYNKITGDCQGTTEQILEWAARKWGFSSMGHPDLMKAVAVAESTWYQNHKGDYETAKYYYSPHPTYPSPDYQSYGISQVKRTTWPGSYPNTWNSTAFSADYTAAVIRMAYDGNSWRGSALKGDLWSSVQFWKDSATSSDRTYANKVKYEEGAKRWRQAGF